MSQWQSAFDGGNVKFFRYNDEQLCAMLADGTSFVAGEVEIFCQNFMVIPNIPA